MAKKKTTTAVTAESNGAVPNNSRHRFRFTHRDRFGIVRLGGEGDRRQTAAFQDGVYETHDPEIAQALLAHRRYGLDFTETKQSMEQRGANDAT